MGVTNLVDRLMQFWQRILEVLPELLLTLLIGFVLIKLAKYLFSNLIKVTRANTALKGILLSVADIVLWLILIVVILNQLGLNQVAMALTSTAAVAGIAFSIASSTFLQDLVAGVFLAQDTDFNIGDLVKIDDVTGTVEKMDARKVRIRDESGVLHILPNSAFDKASWQLIDKKPKGGR